MWRSWKDFWSFERVKRYEEVTGKQMCLDVTGAKGWFYGKMQTYLVPRYGIYYIYTSSVNYGFAGSHGSRAHWVRTFWAQQNTYFSSWRVPCWFFELRVYAAGPASTNRWVGTVCTYFILPYFTCIFHVDVKSCALPACACVSHMRMQNMRCRVTCSLQFTVYNLFC